MFAFFLFLLISLTLSAVKWFSVVDDILLYLRDWNDVYFPLALFGGRARGTIYDIDGDLEMLALLGE